eukprot:TRINITY_DN33163_c0_g1_i1.p1 TRINITY_DN33163_c0_g1~~TRINITY_DN33163_c0_g1_i1.p1  ORF type:complete len:151 (+),score=13.90 TRINITY_DN33163_c0_g1_i1:52-453(+)
MAHTCIAAHLADTERESGELEREIAVCRGLMRRYGSDGFSEGLAHLQRLRADADRKAEELRSTVDIVAESSSYTRRATSSIRTKAAFARASDLSAAATAAHARDSWLTADSAAPSALLPPSVSNPVSPILAAR